MAKRAEVEYREEVKRLQSECGEEGVRGGGDALQAAAGRGEAAVQRVRVRAKQGRRRHRALRAQYDSAVSMGTGTYRDKIARSTEKYRAWLKEAEELVGQAQEDK